MWHAFAPVLADGHNGNGWHHGHWWIVFPLFWLLLFAIVAAFCGPWRRRRSDGADAPRRILAERFARGEISGDEYRDRLAQLQ
jgi:putative membrane protein